MSHRRFASEGKNFLEDQQRWFRRTLEEECRPLLVHLQQREPWLRRFADWAAVASFLSSASDAESDVLLAAIFRAWAGARTDARWQTVLFGCFWRPLSAFFWMKARWDRDQMARWQNLANAFVDTIHAFEVDECPAGTARVIVQRAVGRWYRQYEAPWRNQKRSGSTLFPEIVWQKAEGFTRVAFEDEREHLAELLRRLVEARRLKEGLYALVVETRLHGQSLCDVARQLGISYALAKRRRARAEQVLSPMLRARLLAFAGIGDRPADGSNGKTPTSAPAGSLTIAA